MIEAQLQVRGPSRRFVRAAAERLAALLSGISASPTSLPPAEVEALESLAKARLWLDLAVLEEASQPCLYRARDLVREALGDPAGDAVARARQGGSISTPPAA
jgi:hypothetical protein